MTDLETQKTELYDAVCKLKNDCRASGTNIGVFNGATCTAYTYCCECEYMCDECHQECCQVDDSLHENCLHAQTKNIKEFEQVQCSECYLKGFDKLWLMKEKIPFIRKCFS